MSCCNLYGNAMGDWVGCVYGQDGENGNVSENPLFCNPGDGDFTLTTDSPCAEANSGGCGLIGAWDVGCDQSIVSADGVIDPAYGAPVATDSGDDGNGNDVMDLLSLWAYEDDAHYYFCFTIDGNIAAANWGKYALYVDTTNDSEGATFDAWTRNVVVEDPHKPEYGIYTWVNDVGPYGTDKVQLFSWNGVQWDGPSEISAAGLQAGNLSVIEWQIAKASFGRPDTLWCEVWSTGGGPDNAQDTINDPPEDWNATDWTTQAVLLCSTAIEVEEATHVEDWGTLPDRFHISRCVPNPSQGSTRLTYVVPAKAHHARVQLTVNDLVGRRVRSLADRGHESGIYEVTWDGRDHQGALAPAGIYFFRLDCAGKTERSRLILLR
ncbi:FlgD immunoglobulin-like domain containing protein, partial [Candidatus Eisenbacteria bacterium]